MGAVNCVMCIILLAVICGLPAAYGNVELRALMEIKLSLDPHNKYLSSWTDGGDPCSSGTFEGVACNEHRKVCNISLQGRGLDGTVSAAVAELKCLSGLYLHYNSLTGGIPREVGQLTELTDLYLDVNNLTGTIPPEVRDMKSLQVLQLCCNQLTGGIPPNMGSLKKLSVLALQHNRLNGTIPSSLGDSVMLKRLDLSFNQLSGPIPTSLANVTQLEVLDVQNNSLSGVVPPALKGLNGGFNCSNNQGLCGVGFPSLKVCTGWDQANIIQVDPSTKTPNNTTNNASVNIPALSKFHAQCNQSHCSSSSKFMQFAFVSGVITVTVILTMGGFLIIFICYRRRKQKVGNSLDTSDGQLSTPQAKELSRRTPSSPLLSPAFSNGWNAFVDVHDMNGGFQEFPIGLNYNLEDVESATQYFSEVNLLGKSNLSAIYKGILKDGSVVAVKSINVTCCKSEEAEFMKGLSLLTSLRHKNLVKLKGFCCSKERGEIFLIYDFAPKGNLSQYLDVQDGSSHVLDWTTRVTIINGIAKGILYLHSNEPSKASIVHQNISIKKVLMDENLEPLISDSGLLKLLADDVVFSALKCSAALGYMAPEYITTGRFTEKSDVYAFGVIILQILSGRSKLSYLMRLAAESYKLEDFIDPFLRGKFFDSEAARLTEIALACTHELPDLRPSMEAVVEELKTCGS